MIQVHDLTMTYPSGKGVFNLNFEVKKGEIIGFLGPNGAGKTTTIRALLGFMKADEGSATINGYDCWGEATKTKNSLGFIPGEIAFFDHMDGHEFLDFMLNMRKTNKASRKQELLDLFELNPSGKIKKFSKGMKQKLAIVSAFMHDPDVLILDEPTSGLDPLVQNKFINFILDEKKCGKTILMSSHIFEEVERTCDEVIIIKEGKIVNQSDVHSLKASQRKGFIVYTSSSNKLAKELKKEGFEIEDQSDKSFNVFVSGNKVDEFIKTISKFPINNLEVINQSLDQIFIQFYKKEGK